MKCLEKDRTRRYETRQRAGPRHPAVPGGRAGGSVSADGGLRLRKFARKYKTPLRVAVAFLLLLVLGAIVSAWQAVRATLAERDARDHEREAIQSHEETRQERDKVAGANQKLEQVLGDLRHTLYVADVNRAYRFWDEGNVARTMELLERQRPTANEPDLRGVEWHYLERLCRRLEAGLKFDAKAPISALAISPDARMLATLSNIGRAQLWDATTGALRSNFPITEGVLLGWPPRCSFAPDGATLISAAMDGHVRMWDVATGKQRSDTKPKLSLGVFSQIAFGPDGTKLMGFTPDSRVKLRLWDSATGRELAALDPIGEDPTIERASAHSMAQRRTGNPWHGRWAEPSWFGTSSPERSSSRTTRNIPGATRSLCRPTGNCWRATGGDLPTWSSSGTWSPTSKSRSYRAFVHTFSCCPFPQTASYWRPPATNRSSGCSMSPLMPRSPPSKATAARSTAWLSRPTASGCIRRERMAWPDDGSRAQKTTPMSFAATLPLMPLG